MFTSVKIPKAITRAAVSRALSWTATDTTASIRMNVYKTKEDATTNASTRWAATSANVTLVTPCPRTVDLASMEHGVQKTLVVTIIVIAQLPAQCAHADQGIL